MSFFYKLLGALPSVKEPVQVPNVKKKLIWTVIVLVIFFVMGTIQLIGLDTSRIVDIGFYQTILASNMGTIISLGIGPIVLASIILQLLVGVKIINLDFSNKDGRAKFSALQKFLAIILSIVEAIVMVTIGLLHPLSGMMIFVVTQIALGSIFLMYLDEVVTKYGIGSGIGLFIAAGVCKVIIWTIFVIPSVATGGGLLFQAISYMKTGAMIQLLSYVILPIIITLLVFLIVVFVENMHVNIPLTVGRSGIGAKYPVKLLYVSNMPVILTATLFANLALFARLASGTFLEGIVFTITNVLRPQNRLLQNIILGGVSGTAIVNALIYMVIFVAFCVLFGVFWVRMANQSSKSVAQQLQRSGMSIPGFRRDERVLTTVLKRYIPTITILGSIFVGLLAFFADISGSIGGGIGILLTVGIIYRFYEQLAKDQLFESSSFMKQLIGRK